MRLGWSILIPMVALGCTGNTNNITQLHSQLVALPESLDFGDVVVGESSTLDLTITNKGRVPLEISDASLLDGSAGVISFTLDATEASPVEVAVNDTLTVPVTMTPADYIAYTDTLEISSDDPDAPTTEIPITAMGVGPDIELSCDLDFGAVNPGDTATQTLELSNVGATDLILGTTSMTGSGAFSLGNVIDDDQISPGFPVFFNVNYTPVNSYGDTAILTIPSNDPDENPYTCTFIGNGGGDGNYPVANIACPDEHVLPGDTVSFDASTSTDPNSEALTYAWSLDTRPDGSLAEVSSTDPTASLLTDVVGTYSVSVTVTNADNVSSAPYACPVIALPVADLYVELTWDVPDTDMDLHLSQADSDFFDVPGDVSWCNCNPDWGVADVTTDDPALGNPVQTCDRSVTPYPPLYYFGSGGPEHISIDSPADGDYEVRVHDDDGPDETYATVRFYVRGELKETDTLQLSRNDEWDIATIRWPYGYIVDTGTDPFAATAESCPAE